MEILTKNRRFYSPKQCLGALAIIGFALTGAAPSAHAQENANMKNETQAQITKEAQQQTTGQRTEIVAEAVSALRETRQALRNLDNDKPEKALAAIGRATGKLEVVLARSPELALAPLDVTATRYDFIGTLEAVRETVDDAENLLEDNRVQQARRILNGLASETVIKTTNLPLATYPEALKDAAALVEQELKHDAKRVLQDALNTLVVTKTVLPHPVISADYLLAEAQELTANSDRTEAQNTRLTQLLNMAEKEVKFARALGYAAQEDVDVFHNQLEKIREKTEGDKSGTGFFGKIKKSVMSMFDSAQAPQTETSKQK